MNSRVSIIILNWNGWRDTIECLESLYQISYPLYDVILVDNGSQDGSIFNLRKYAEGSIIVESGFFHYSPDNKPLKIIEYSRMEAERGGGREGEMADLPPSQRLIIIINEENYGFAEGNDIAIRYALKALDPRYILLLNNDTVVDRAFLDRLVEVIEGDGSIGFVGPKIYYYDFKGNRDVISAAGMKLDMWKGRSIHRGETESDRGQYDHIEKVDFVEGSCLLASRTVLERIGLLNSKYFSYWEETDLCWRGLKSGYSSVYVPQSQIWHKVRSSSIKMYYLARNRLWFMREHAAWMQKAFFFAYFFGYQLLMMTAVLLRKREKEKLISLLKGVRDGLLEDA